MTIRRRKNIKMILPLASLGDIAFLLMIFFMLVSSFVKDNYDLTPAQSAYVRTVENAQISVSLDENETIWMQGLKVTVGQIAGAVETLVSDHPQDVLVHVKIDKNLKRESYMPVMEALSESGVKLILTGQKAN